MKRFFFVAFVVLAAAACAQQAPYRNERPGIAFPPAHQLIQKCRIAVQFNEDEASVPESDYLDGMFCLGFMEGILGANTVVYAGHPDAVLFCIPEPGIKTWVAAKAVVEFAAARPDLLDLVEAEFAVKALTAKYPCMSADSSFKPRRGLIQALAANPTRKE